MRFGRENLGWGLIINLSHTFNFCKDNIVSFFICVALVFVNLNCCCSTLLNECNNELGGVLTVMVGDDMLLSIIEEADTEST